MREKIIRRFAGIMILGSLALSQLHDIHWLWLTAFVGLNLFQSSLTGFCPLEWGLKKAGVKSSGDVCGTK
ncbi:MAG: DUF2892 domain-containing protein [Chitinophagaceae bacterium]|nr:DUF2892 domain-containing protein [Chitinophagaceae bacterium]